MSKIKKSKKDWNLLDETSPNKKSGRPPKAADEKMTEKVTVNFTPSEKEKLLEKSNELGGLPLSILIRNGLKKASYI